MPSSCCCVRELILFRSAAALAGSPGRHELIFPSSSSAGTGKGGPKTRRKGRASKPLPGYSISLRVIYIHPTVLRVGDHPMSYMSQFVEVSIVCLLPTYYAASLAELFAAKFTSRPFFQSVGP